MIMIYFSSDHHFFDKGILKRKDKEGNLQRNFNNITEHNNYIIKQHNQTVKPSDTVYLLGDICFNENELKGARKYFTLGAGFKYNIVKIDVSYLFSTSTVKNPLENTLRFSLTFNFGDKYDEL